MRTQPIKSLTLFLERLHMKTKIEMPEEKKKRFLKIAREIPCTNGIRPERFIKVLKTDLTPKN